MANIKKINWKKGSGGYYDAYIRKYQFLTLMPNIIEPYRTYEEFKDVLTRTQYFIKVWFPTSKYKDKPLKTLGLMNFNEAKAKAEQIIKKEILSFIDLT